MPSKWFNEETLQKLHLKFLGTPTPVRVKREKFKIVYKMPTSGEKVATKMEDINLKYMNKGCPCGKGGKSTVGPDPEPGCLSNFYRFAGDYHFYCSKCLQKLHDKFLRDMETYSYHEAVIRSKDYLKLHKDMDDDLKG